MAFRPSRWFSRAAIVAVVLGFGAAAHATPTPKPTTTPPKLGLTPGRLKAPAPPPVTPTIAIGPAGGFLAPYRTPTRTPLPLPGSSLPPRGPSLAPDRPVIELFAEMPDCGPPGLARRISYRVSNRVAEVKINALSSDDTIREIYRQTAPPGSPFKTKEDSGIRDPRADVNLVAYVLVATGANGQQANRRLTLRYSETPIFEVLSPRAHRGRWADQSYSYTVDVRTQGIARVTYKIFTLPARVPGSEPGGIATLEGSVLRFQGPLVALGSVELTAHVAGPCKTAPLTIVRTVLCRNRYQEERS